LKLKAVLTKYFDLYYKIEFWKRPKSSKKQRIKKPSTRGLTVKES